MMTCDLKQTLMLPIVLFAAPIIRKLALVVMREEPSVGELRSGRCRFGTNVNFHLPATNWLACAAAPVLDML